MKILQCKNTTKMTKKNTTEKLNRAIFLNSDYLCQSSKYWYSIFIIKTNSEILLNELSRIEYILIVAIIIFIININVKTHKNN